MPTLFHTPEVSVVIPVYKNEGTVSELHYRLREVLQTQALTYEILFVDDACPHSSLNHLKELTICDPQVAVLSLGQNVGQHCAVLIGLAHALGQKIIVMDADLQDSPEAIPKILDRLGEGFTAVFAGKYGQYESLFQLLTARLFKRLLHYLCGIPADAGMFFVIDQQLVPQLLSFFAPVPYIVAMIGCSGFPLTSVPVRRIKRQTGHSAYTFWKRLKIGCLAIIWTLIWQWWPPARATTHQKSGVIKDYFGLRFSSTQMEKEA